jgi:hypothetical protein
MSSLTMMEREINNGKKTGVTSSYMGCNGFQIPLLQYKNTAQISTS